MNFKCLLCGADEMSVIKEKTRNSAHRVVACKECGLQQLFPLPSAEEDQTYYDDNPTDRQHRISTLSRYMISFIPKMLTECGI